MTARPSSGHSRPSHTGFTLVELLTVMAIITILLTLVRPAVTGLARGQGFTGNVYDVDYLIRQAKATAMAQNTFVWLGFRSTNADGTPLTVNGSPALVVVTVVSRNGLSAAVPSSASPTPVPTPTPTSSPYQMISKPMILPNVQLDPTGALGQTPSVYTHLAGFDATNNVDVSGSGYAFSQTVPGIANAMAFTAVLAFGPDGTASLGTATAVRTVGIGLKSVPASAATAQIAAIQISGVNGRSTLFRQ